MFLVMDPSAEAEARASALRAAIRDSLGPRPQRWLADASGLHPDVVSRLLLGKQTLQLEHLVAIAQALGVSTRGLLAQAGYIDSDGLIDPDRFPRPVNQALRAIAKEFSVDNDGPDDPEAVR